MTQTCKRVYKRVNHFWGHKGKLIVWDVSLPSKIHISGSEHKKCENCRTCGHPLLTTSYKFQTDLSRKKLWQFKI